MSLARELVFTVDFNAMDEQGRIKASIRFASSPEVPGIGEEVRLVDAELNTCLGRVDELRLPLIAVRPDPATWVPGVDLEVSGPFSGAVFSERVVPREPTESPKARATGQLQAA